MSSSLARLRRPRHARNARFGWTRYLLTFVAVALVGLGLGTRALVTPDGAKADTVTSSDGNVTLTVTASPTTLPAGGGSVTYTYTLTNNMTSGTTTLRFPAGSVPISDPSCSPITFSRVSGGTMLGQQDALAQGQLWRSDKYGSAVYTCTRTVTQTTTSTASASFWYYSPDGTTTLKTSVSAKTTVTVGTVANSGSTSTSLTKIACTTPTVWVAQNDVMSGGPYGTTLYQQYTTAVSSDFITVSHSSQWGYNALAYNPVDGFLYAVSNWSSTNGYTDAGHLLRIDGSGNIQDLGQMPKASFYKNGGIDDLGTTITSTTGNGQPGGINAGAISPSGVYYFSNMSNSGSGQIYSLDLTKLSATPTTTQLTPTKLTISSTYLNSYGEVLGQYRMNDFTIVGGKLEGINNGTNSLVTFDPATGSFSSTPVTGLTAATYGAVWTYGNGNLGMDANSGAMLAQVSPSGTLLNSVKGIVASNNDGASCTGNNSVDLGLTKLAQTNVAPNGVVTFTLRVTNNGTGVSSGGYITDQFPAGYTNVTVQGPAAGQCTTSSANVTVNTGATANQTTLTCQTGILNPGDSYDITVTANAPTWATTDPAKFTNCATVTGNEADPTSTNNKSCYATYVTNARIDLAKTADSATATGPDANGVYTVSYTIKVTNSGAVAGTYGQIVDRPQFPAGTTISTFQWSGGPTGAAATTVTPDANGIYAVGAASTTLAAGATDTYRVTLSVKVTAGTQLSSCTGAPDNGFYNVANVNGETASSSTANNVACENPGKLDVTKTAGTVSGPDAKGVYTASYTVTVTNGATAAGTYGPLLDTPTFDPNLTVVGLTSNGTTLTPGANGAYTLAGVTSIAAGASDTYAVTVMFTYATQGAIVSACGATPTAGQGLYNTVRATGETGPLSDNSACLNPPALNVVKKAASVSGPDATGTYTARYTVTATNTGTVTTTYGPLLDTPRLDPNLKVTGLSSNGTSISPDGSGAYTLSAPKQIAAGATDTYDVVVSFTFATQGATVSACGSTPTADHGLFNTVSATGETATTSDNSACLDVPALNLVKKAGSVSGPDASGVYKATYTITATNTGTVTASYGPLVDTPQFDKNATVTGASWTGATAGSATTAGPFTLTSALRTLAAGASEQWTITVTFTNTSGSQLSACGGAGTGLYNAVSATGESGSTTDNAACLVPPTFGTPIHVAKLGDGGALPGATFALYAVDPATSGATPVTGGITADAGGTTFTTTNLEYGKTYWLVETKAPTGYNLLATPIRLSVGSNGIVVASGGDAAKVTGTGNLTLEVTDTKVGSSLPRTGGAGVATMPLAGLAVLALVLVGPLARRRRGEQ